MCIKKEIKSHLVFFIDQDFIANLIIMRTLPLFTVMKKEIYNVVSP